MRQAGRATISRWLGGLPGIGGRRRASEFLEDSHSVADRKKHLPYPGIHGHGVVEGADRDRGLVAGPGVKDVSSLQCVVGVALRVPSPGPVPAPSTR